MREAEMRANIERDIADAEPVERPPIIPIEGSNLIQFSNRTDSNLAGCSTIGIIEVIHKGTMDEALVVLRNEAYRLNTNVLVPYAMEQEETDDIVFAKIQIEGADDEMSASTSARDVNYGQNNRLEELSRKGLGHYG